MSANFDDVKRKLNKEESKKEESKMSFEDEEKKSDEMTEREYIDSRIELLNTKVNDYANVTDSSIKGLKAEIAGLPTKKELEIVRSDIEVLSEEIGMIRKLLEKNGAVVPETQEVFTAVSGKVEVTRADKDEAELIAQTLSGKPVDYVFRRIAKKVTKKEESYEPLTEEELDKKFT